MDWKEVDRATIWPSSFSFFSSTVSYLSWKTDPEFQTIHHTKVPHFTRKINYFAEVVQIVKIDSDVPSVTAAALSAPHSPVPHSHTSPENENPKIFVMAITELS
jgi:hypothetical protein